MKRILLLTIAMLTGATVALAQEPPDQSKPKRDKPPLTDEQRAQMEQRVNEAWAALPVESKMRLMRLHRALSEMPPDERRFIHDRVERFLNMTPEEREKLTQLRKQWEQMTPEERQKAREAYFRKWRQEHPGEERPWFRPRKPVGPNPAEGEGAPPQPPPPPQPPSDQ